MTLYLALVRNKIGFSLEDDVGKFVARLKSEYGCEVQVDVFDSSIDLEWEPYNVQGLWGPKDLKTKLAATQLLPPKHLYHVVYFVYDAADYPEPGPLANWTYWHDFNGSALCFLVVKKAWLRDDNLANGLWHETKHAFHRILEWRNKPLADFTDGPGTETDSDNRVLFLLKKEKETVLLPPSARIAPPVAPQPPQTSGVAQALIGILQRVLGLQTELLARQYTPPLKTPSGLDGIIATFGDHTKPTFGVDYIVNLKLPYPLIYQGKAVKTIQCHRLIKEQALWCFSEIKRRGLESQVKEYGGSFVQRNIRGENVPSTHSFGIAIDLEPTRLPLGSTESFSKEVLEIFSTAGFVNGATFPTRKDPMHFQYCKDY